MAKAKTVFYCQNCGAQSPKWVGRCASCGQWNTYVEEVVRKETSANLWKKPDDRKRQTPQPQLMQDISAGGGKREVLPVAELNRVLGRGLVPGSLVLLGGIS